jgi:hypothetical protein
MQKIAETEMLALIGNLVNAGMNIYSAKSTIDEKLKDSKLDTIKGAQQQYELGKPSEYAFGIDRKSSRTLSSWRR